MSFQLYLRWCINDHHGRYIKLKQATQKADKDAHLDAMPMCIKEFTVRIRPNSASLSSHSDQQGFYVFGLRYKQTLGCHCDSVVKMNNTVADAYHCHSGSYTIQLSISRYTKWPNDVLEGTGRISIM
jgi:hypothetical protein